MREIQYNGNKYRKAGGPVSIRHEPNHLCPANLGQYEFFYKGLWHPLKNYMIRYQLDNLIDN